MTTMLQNCARMNRGSVERCKYKDAGRLAIAGGCKETECKPEELPRVIEFN